MTVEITLLAFFAFYSVRKGIKLDLIIEKSRNFMNIFNFPLAKNKNVWYNNNH